MKEYTEEERAEIAFGVMVAQVGRSGANQCVVRQRLSERDIIGELLQNNFEPIDWYSPLKPIPIPEPLNGKR